MKTFFLNLKKSQQISLVTLVLITIVIATLASFWVLKSHYQPLSKGGVDESEVRLLAELEQQGIDYKIDANGDLLVLDEQLGKGQLLAGKDSLNNFSSHGLELYDNADYSMTEHTQKVTFQRALQGELERTISALSYVSYARVHISLAEKKLFSSQQEASTAAVTLFTSQVLNDEQVSSVKVLVSSSVDGLSAKDVTVLSSDGEVLSSTLSTDESDTFQVSRKGNVEQALEKKAAKVLNLFFSPSQYAISLNSQLNHEQLKQVSKELLVDGNGKGAIISQRMTTNSTQSKAKNSNESSEVTYAHGSRTQELIKTAGEIKRLSVAVAIHVDISDVQLSKLKDLLSAAIGLDINRGDQLTVEAFPPIIKQPEVVMTPVVEQTTVVAPVEKKVNVAPKETSLMPKLHFSATDAGYLSLALLVLCILALGFSFNRKRLTKQQRELTLIEINQWLAGEKHVENS